MYYSIGLTGAQTAPVCYDNTVFTGECGYMTLKDVKVGHSATVVKLNGEGALRRRIMDMGITKGVKITVRKVAPLGDPLELTVRGYELSLRKAGAELIEVE